MLITLLFLGLPGLVLLLFFLIFTPIQLVETHVVSTRMVAVELMGLSELDMRKREVSRMLPGCFPCSAMLEGGIGIIIQVRVWIEKQVLFISEPGSILTLQAGRAGGANKRG